MELSIDTSTSSASLALSDKGSVIAELNWRTEQNHTVELIPNILHLLQQYKTDIRRIQAIMVARGPGSFNSLRVGLATAKGLAFVLDIPLVGISTLEAAAFPPAGFGLPVCPILSTRRDEIATALFQFKNGVWEKLVAEHITTVDELCAEIVEPTIFCGDSELLEQFKHKPGDKALIFKEPIPHRAGCLAYPGWCRIESKDFDDPSTLQPLYLKKPAITIPKKRRHDAVSNMW